MATSLGIMYRDVRPGYVMVWAVTAPCCVCTALLVGRLLRLHRRVMHEVEKETGSERVLELRMLYGNVAVVINMIKLFAVTAFLTTLLPDFGSVFQLLQAVVVLMALRSFAQLAVTLLGGPVLVPGKIAEAPPTKIWVAMPFGCFMRPFTKSRRATISDLMIMKRLFRATMILTPLLFFLDLTVDGRLPDDAADNAHQVLRVGIAITGAVGLHGLKSFVRVIKPISVSRGKELGSKAVGKISAQFSLIRVVSVLPKLLLLLLSTFSSYRRKDDSDLRLEAFLQMQNALYVSMLLPIVSVAAWRIYPASRKFYREALDQLLAARMLDVKVKRLSRNRLSDEEAGAGVPGGLNPATAPITPVSNDGELLMSGRQRSESDHSVASLSSQFIRYCPVCGANCSFFGTRMDVGDFDFDLNRADVLASTLVPNEMASDERPGAIKCTACQARLMIELLELTEEHQPPLNGTPITPVPLALGDLQPATVGEVELQMLEDQRSETALALPPSQKGDAAVL